MKEARPIDGYDTFAEQFRCASESAGKDQYLIPYFISGHPGSTLKDMVEMALYLKSKGYRPRQVQDFIPTPMSLAATMYYTGIDPLAEKPVYTAKGLREKRMQKALLLYWDPAQGGPGARGARGGGAARSHPGAAPDVLWCRPGSPLHAKRPHPRNPARASTTRTLGRVARAWTRTVILCGPCASPCRCRSVLPCSRSVLPAALRPR